MATLIRNRRIVDDSWLLLEPQRWLQVGEDGLVPDFPDALDVIVPLKLWRLRREDLLARQGRLGLQLDADADLTEVAADLGRFALVAVKFAKFGDGRGNSTGRLLRERYGFEGELRAVGQVARDLLFYMESCGFDAFVLRDGEDPEEALTAFYDFSESYQASAARPEPLFRRRLAHA